MRMITRMRTGEGLWNDIDMAGKPSSDFSGLLCLPHFEGRAVPAIARHLLGMNWRTLWLNYLRASRKRTRLLLRHFPDREFAKVDIGGINPGETVDNTICPFAELPATWDDFLTGSLSANTRQKVRRFLKRVEESDDFRLTHADGESFERDLDTVVEFWSAQWAAGKGEQAEVIRRTIRLVATDCFRDGTLVMPLLWRGDRPLGGLVCFTDRAHDSLLFYVAGRDQSFDDLPAGLVLHAHTIRYAIENGFKTYDFLRGNEPYKYSFATGEYRVINTRVETKSGANLGARIDPMSVPMVLALAKDLARNSHAAAAEYAYRQVLQIDTGCCEAVEACRKLTTARVAGMRP
jgi:CelD/BcsL family acetyltransferase involved in cellulose biosynthesis